MVTFAACPFTADYPEQREGQSSQLFAVGRVYFIFVSAAISSLPSAVLIVSCTCSPLPPAGIVAEMRFPFFGSAFTASLNNTASPRFNVTRNGVARSILKNRRFSPDAACHELLR